MTDRSFQARSGLGGFRIGGVPLFRHAKWMLAGWLVAEVLLFSLVVREIGVGGAILLGILTSLVGVATLRRLGRDAIGTLRTTVGNQVPPEGALLDGSLAALGALLLILPGFASDLVGLALVTPSLRRSLMNRFGGGPTIGQGHKRSAPPGVIDLAPEEWSVSEPARR